MTTPPTAPFAPLLRQDRWERRLLALAAQTTARPWAWGVTDCGSTACAALATLAFVDVSRVHAGMGLRPYATRFGAWRTWTDVLARHGSAGGAFAALGCVPEPNPRLTRAGDLLVVDGGARALPDLAVHLGRAMLVLIEDDAARVIPLAAYWADAVAGQPVAWRLG